MKLQWLTVKRVQDLNVDDNVISNENVNILSLNNDHDDNNDDTRNNDHEDDENDKVIMYKEQTPPSLPL